MLQDLRTHSDPPLGPAFTLVTVVVLGLGIGFSGVDRRPA